MHKLFYPSVYSWRYLMFPVPFVDHFEMIQRLKHIYFTVIINIWGIKFKWLHEKYVSSFKEKNTSFNKYLLTVLLK